MAVEVVGFEMVQGPVDTVTEGCTNVLHEKENGKLDQGPGLNEPMKFGSHGDEPIKGEGNGVSDANFPKDAVDEWPAPKQIHYFYFVRCRSYDDPKIKAKIDQADKEIQRKNQARFQITEALKAKLSDRAELISQIRALKDESRQFKAILDEKRKEIEPLQQALWKLRNTNTVGRGSGLCSSEEELNDFIHGLQYRIQHESIPLSEEKQLLREIRQLEATREKVVANAAMRAKIQDSLGQREDIQDQVKLIGGDLDGVRKEKQVLQTKIKQIEDTLTAVDDGINSLSEELKAVIQKRDKAYESIQQLRKQRDEGNACFYQSRTALNKARELAAKKDIKALEELSHSEVENFLSLWSSNKAFKEDYEKRILPSLDGRQLSRDGRMRNPDEKPLVVLEEPTFSETQTMAKASVKELKEDSKSTSQVTLPTQKAQKETKNKATHPKSTLEHNKVEEDREIPGLEELPKNTPAKANEVDAAKLKEMKREQEIAKAKQAIERKKKLVEKAAAKAAIKAQKEAEKKLKEREKKAKKKASASALATDPEKPPMEVVSEDAEQEKIDEIVEAPVAAKQKVQREKVQKGNTIRPRNRSKGPDSVPKVFLKRKKSTNYWIWAAPAAVLVVLFLLLGYYYLF
ncbi:proton pump-interactor 1-like [Juglans microcarpa x Juglans regia]|uniref:proton pump-interactor 1-like n=1 Tax=Juglans microcarpa x Juglans regia TaxID=2249226 RepID=UPI001B7F200E|nr:proton pump-interactor 1-like [Juglans microcarpa x Juglans regia]